VRWIPYTKASHCLPPEEYRFYGGSGGREDYDVTTIVKRTAQHVQDISIKETEERAITGDVDIPTLTHHRHRLNGSRGPQLQREKSEEG
jgi:hypothetical protein